MLLVALFLEEGCLKFKYNTFSLSYYVSLWVILIVERWLLCCTAGGHLLSGHEGATAGMR